MSADGGAVEKCHAERKIVLLDEFQQAALKVAGCVVICAAVNPLIPDPVEEQR